MTVNQDTRSGPSFTLKNRLLRALWNLCWSLLGRTSPAPLHIWRAFLLRCFGARIGKGVHVYPEVKIWAPWHLQIGDQSGIGNGATLYCQGKMIVGKRVVISQGAHLCGGTHDYTQVGFPLVPGDISIGDDVWIAAEAFVHPGVSVGEGAILGARGVATKNLEGWTIYAGNPARALKKRIGIQSISVQL
jgi:putative colanic acid biosynthesis acetyltransferase WcaF